jgi:hypothetical protein
MDSAQTPKGRLYVSDLIGLTLAIIIKPTPMHGHYGRKLMRTHSGICPGLSSAEFESEFFLVKLTFVRFAI